MEKNTKLDLSVQTFNDYTKKARKTAQYPRIGNNVFYPVLGLIGESGEVADQVKRIQRDDGEKLLPPRIEKLTKELGDVAWYLQQSMFESAIPFDSIAELNMTIIDYQKAIQSFPPEFENFASQTVYLNSLTNTAATYMYAERTCATQYFLDILETLMTIANMIGIEFQYILETNLKKLYKRKDEGKIQGEGGER